MDSPIKNNEMPKCYEEGSSRRLFDGQKFNKALLLFSEDKDWEILPCVQMNPAAPTFKKSLEERIRQLLTGSEIPADVFARVRMHLEYQICLSENHQRYSNVLELLYGLNFFGIRLSSYTDNKERWMSAKSEFGKLIASTATHVSYQPQDGVVVKCKAILELRKWGYEIPIVHGRIQQTPSDVARFSESMRYQFDKIGGVSVLIILHRLESIFCSEMGRYMFHHSPARLETPQLDIPWGYLFNVALSYLTQTRKMNEVTATKVFERICNVAKYFIATIELQPLTIFDDMLRSSYTSMSELQEAIMYEQHFGLDQIRPDFLLMILKGLVGQRPPDRIADIFVDILAWVCKQQNRKVPISFTVDSLMRELHSASFSRKEIEESLSLLSQKALSLNAGCTNPYEASKRDYFKRPFVVNNDKYYLVSGLFFAKGFYFAWKARSHDKNEDLGKMFEHCVADMFNSHNVSARSNVKYKVSKAKQSDLRDARQMAECDFIVETEAEIFFIEMKNKEITADAMSGNPAAALTDMAKSALYGMTQAAIHEYCLRSDGQLKFDDGSVLELRKRRIVKIHLSAFDHYGLHDNMLLLRYLQASLSLDYSCAENPEALKSVADYQQKFRNVMATKIMQAAYKNNNERLMSFHSFSLPQFMTILMSANTTDEFVSEMKLTMYMTTGAKDWYHDYAFLKGLYAR